MFCLLLSSFWLHVPLGYRLRFHFSFLGYSPYFLVFPVLSALLSFFLQCFSCSIFHALFVIFFSCAISWSWSPWFSPVLFLYNHTFPEYLISTIPHPRRIYRQTHRPRKRKIAPKQPLLLSPVVRLITPPCYPLRIHGSNTTNPFNSNFGELDVRRLARCFCFILNFMF